MIPFYLTLLALVIYFMRITRKKFSFIIKFLKKIRSLVIELERKLKTIRKIFSKQGLGEYFRIMSAFWPTFAVIFLLMLPFWYKMYQSLKPQPQQGKIYWQLTKEEFAKYHQKVDDTMVVMLRNDSEVMEFLSTSISGKLVITAHFTWDKSKERGTWYQNYDNDSGWWYLYQDKDDSKLFGGKVCDKRGIITGMTLELG